MSQNGPGMQLNELHSFVSSHCPVELHGRSLTAEDTLSFVKTLLPRAFHVDAEEDELYSFM
jgi:hypothetical protein